MNKNIMRFAVAAVFALFLSPAAFSAHAGHQPQSGAHGRGNGAWQQNQEQAMANEEARHKIARFQTGEGVCGARAWKEYSVNPKAKGDAILLVVFGGRDSVSRGGDNGPAVPPAIEKALDFARHHAADTRLIVLVPEMTVEGGGGGRRGLEKPSADDIAKLVRLRAEANGIRAGRVFATGFSMGGGRVCSLLNADPTLFARALIVGASGDPSAIADVRAEVMSIHGADDDLIPIARVRAYAEALNARRRGAMEVKVLAKTGHAESEKAAYEKADAWKWLLR